MYHYLSPKQLISFRIRAVRDAQVNGYTWASRQYGLSRQTLYRWARDPQPKQRGPSKRVWWQTDEDLEALVCQLRLSTNYGPKRIKAELLVFGYTLGEKAIRGCLNRAGLVHNHRKKRNHTKRKFYAPYPGYRVQIDTKAIDDGSSDKRTTARHQYTAIDICSKIRFTALYDGLASSHTIEFAGDAVAFYKDIGIMVECIQTDNHATFTNLYGGRWASRANRQHPFTRWCESQGIHHLLSRPSTPKHNAFVERSHRTDEEEFYRLRDITRLNTDQLRFEMRQWQDDYNWIRLHSSCNYMPPMKYYLTVLQTGA